MRRTPKISNRGLNTPPSPIRHLVPFAEAAKKLGVKVFHLNIGQPDIKSPSRFLNALKTYPDAIVAYENSLGNLKLRESLAKYYRKNGIPVSFENIIVTTGGSEAIIFALLVSCDPGDECLVFEPFYANYLGFATMAGAKLKAIPTSPKTGFHLPNISQITRHIGNQTRALVIINPNNPTGTVYGKKELKLINKIAREFNLTIISDETYREFVYDGAKHYSFLSLGKKPQNVILVDSLSKRMSLCGARVGCLVTFNQEVLESVTKFAQTRLSSPSVEQHAAVEALKTPKAYYAKVNKEYKKRRDTIIGELSTIPGVFVRKPEGAFYCVARLPVVDTEEFSKWLLTDFRYRNSTVMLAPAAGFYLSKNLGLNEVRIAYVLNAKDLKKAMTILRKALATYPHKS